MTIIASNWFPGETLPFLFVAMISAFSLGLICGWIIWGRLRKFIGEHENNAERLQRSISSLEDDLKRAEEDKQKLLEERNAALATN